MSKPEIQDDSFVILKDVDGEDIVATADFAEASVRLDEAIIERAQTKPEFGTWLVRTGLYDRELSNR